MEIRHIRPEDDGTLAAILRYNLEMYGLNIPGTAYFDPSVDHLSGYYTDIPGRAYLVAVDEDGTVAGGVGFGETEGFPRRAELQKMYLAEVYKGQGIGSKLMDTVCERARTAGYEELYLETHHVLDKAIRLYERKGFVQVDAPKDTPHPTMDRFYLKALK